MIVPTTPLPVIGSVQVLRIFGLPSFAQCSITATTRFTPATRSIAPPGPFTILPVAVVAGFLVRDSVEAAPETPDSVKSATLAEHYRAVAEVMPVMLVSNVFIARGPKFGLDTLKLVLEATDKVVAIKDDMCGEFARKMSLLVHDRWAVVSGGQKQNHLNNHPYGCDGFLSTFITFKPEIAHAYWQAVVSGNLAETRRIIRDYDYPFFELIMGLPGGFNAGIQAMLELKGIAQRWRRKPYHSLADQEIEAFAAGLRKIGILA